MSKLEWKSNLEHKLPIFEVVIEKQNENTVNPAKLVYKKIYVQEKILRTRNCRRKFIKNLLPEKHKENM